MIPATISLPEVLQIIRQEIRVPLPNIARHTGFCPGCYKAYELGRMVLSEQSLQWLMHRLPILQALLQPEIIPDAPPKMQALIATIQAQLDHLGSLPSSLRHIELSRIALELQWLDGADVPACQ